MDSVLNEVSMGELHILIKNKVTLHISKKSAF